MAKKKTHKKNKASERLNPPFDPRILDIGHHLAVNKRAGRLKRGWIVHADNLDNIRGIARGNNGGNVKGRIHFLFNPSEITASHNIDFTQANGGKPNNGTNALPTLNVGDIGLNLLFDRTYELWDSSKRNTPPGKYGVYSDVWAFYRFFGMTEEGQMAVPDANVPKAFVNKSWESLYPMKPLQATPVYAYIGDKLKYYGLVGNMSVTYSHWTHKMVPARCVVNISIGLAADPNSVPKSERKKVKGKKGTTTPDRDGRTRPGIQP